MHNQHLESTHLFGPPPSHRPVSGPPAVHRPPLTPSPRHPLTLLFLALLLILLHTPAAATTPTAPVTIISATNQELHFTLSIPEYHQDDAGRLHAPGLNSHVTTPGHPALPYYATFIALPPGATATVSIHERGIRETRLENAVQPAPQPADVTERDIFTLAQQLDNLSYRPDQTIYGEDAPFPAARYTLSAPQQARDLRLVTLQLYPLQYNPAAGLLSHAAEIEVHVRFHNARWDNWQPLPTPGDAVAAAYTGSVLNAHQAALWRSRPQTNGSGATVLPVGSDAYRIEVNQDGIYELTFVDLALAGMNVTAVDPNTFQMVYRGEPVAYDFIGDADNQFESDESIRFYGWEFDGSRLERQFIPDNRNYYWLWAGGSSTRIQDTTNPTGHSTPESFPESITHEEDILFQLTRTDKWPTFPNEPDAWYWAGMLKPPATGPQTFTYELNLPHPAASGSDAQITAEVLVRQAELWTHELQVYANGHDAYAGGTSWVGLRNENVTTGTPLSTLVNGPNDIYVDVNTSDNTGNATYYLNRITVDYLRQFIAVADELTIHDINGPHTFAVSGYTVGDPANVIVWDITDRLLPQRIPMTAGNIGGSGPYVYTFGTDRNAGDFLATTTGNLLNPLAITRYDVPDIDPAGNGADWVAISHADFIPALAPLAAHRASPTYGGLQTHVANITDVINQYGYGFPIPGAINAYMDYALNSWSPAPGHLLLVGDATLNPRQLPCSDTFPNDCTGLGDPDPNYLLTDLVFVDRYAGLITSDYTFSLLDDDLLPEFAVGRLPVQTANETQYIVEKTIAYEQKRLTPQDWQENILFVADGFDPTAGNFCNENLNVGTLIPDSLNQVHKCLPENPTPTDIQTLRTEMRQLAVIPPSGVTFMNYRGHGSIVDWSSGPVPILASTDTAWWYPTVGEPHPLILLSMDCLDGNFAYPGIPGLGETFLKLDGAGTVAHWSSTGLGLTSEHTVLQSGFYQGLFQQNLTRIGDTINYAKNQYHLGNWHPSELYSFGLLGDPALIIMRPDHRTVKTAVQPTADPGDNVTFELVITNVNLYPSIPTVVDTLPAGLSYVSATADRPMNVNVSGNTITMTFLEPLARNESAIIDLVTFLDPDFSGNTVLNTATVSGAGLDANPANNTDTATVIIGDTLPLYLPVTLKP